MLRLFLFVMLCFSSAQAQEAPPQPTQQQILESQSRQILLNTLVSLLDENAKLQASLQLDARQIQAVQKINKDLNDKIDSLNAQIKQLTPAPEEPKN